MANYHQIILYPVTSQRYGYYPTNVRLPQVDSIPTNIIVGAEESFIPASLAYITVRQTTDSAELQPVIGYVRFGIQYGGDGNDFTGTDVLPAIGDVKIGIQYGANGIEFTGIYAGGESSPDVIMLDNGKLAKKITDKFYLVM